MLSNRECREPELPALTAMALSSHLPVTPARNRAERPEPNSWQHPTGPDCTLTGILTLDAAPLAGTTLGMEQELRPLTFCFSLVAQLTGERIPGSGCIVSLSLSCLLLPLSLLPGQFHQ